MGVRVKNWKGAWWVFIDHQRQRRAKRVGAGPRGKKLAEALAVKIQARLLEGDLSILNEAADARAGPDRGGLLGALAADADEASAHHRRGVSASSHRSHPAVDRPPSRRRT